MQFKKLEKRRRPSARFKMAQQVDDESSTPAERRPRFSLDLEVENGKGNGNGGIGSRVQPVGGQRKTSLVELGQKDKRAEDGHQQQEGAQQTGQQPVQWTLAAKSKFGELIRMKGRRETFRPRKDTGAGAGEDPPEMFRKAQQEQEKEGFGWITGVLIRCILCIFGATLFLRMSWIAGQAGLLLGFAVILLSFLIVLITAISMSAIATNGEVKSGGCYYLISRSLGPEFGGSIGLILYVANTVNASMNCVGLAEATVDMLRDNFGFSIFQDRIWDTRIYGIATCLLLQSIIFIGTEFENKTQLALMCSICISILSHFVGTFIVTSDKREAGVVGYNFYVFLSNLLPDFRYDEAIGRENNFITVFGVYFPAMTGIMAGANMSGDLRDPSKSIPKGTFWAIAITTLTYGWCMLVTACTTVRDATGFSVPQFDNITNMPIAPECKNFGNCSYGLANNYQVMTLQGAWPPLIYVGIYATTLSSASGCLIGAPRIFQALCADKLFPLIHPFAKGHGANKDPFRAYFLTLLIAISFIMIGSLNAIADLISNFFLGAFAITNFACFDASAAKSPGFRPGFRLFNKWLSLFGSLLCVCIMFMLNWRTSLATFFVFLLLFVFVKYNKSHVNWGTSTDANRYRRALSSLLKISRTEEHVKTYRPQLLCLTGNPAARQALVDFAYCISNGRSLLLCGHIIPHRSSVQATALIKKLNDRFTDWLCEQHIKAFYCAVAHQSLRAGVQCLLQTVGLGKMQPNILMIGHNSHWLRQCISDSASYQEYMGVIADAFEADMAACVFRNENDGLDHSALLSEEDQLFVRLPDLLLSDRESSLTDDLNRGVEARKVRPKAKAAQSMVSSGSKTELSLPNLLQMDRHPSGGGAAKESKMTRQGSSGNVPRKHDHLSVGRVPQNAKFRTHIRGGYVDVWWLHDDGGLTLLLSYLLTEHNTYLPNAKLRIFTICSKLDPDEVHQNLVGLLKKFRIQFATVHVFSEEYEKEKLYPETMEEYQELVELLKPVNIDEALLEKTRERTFRYLRHRELLLEFSSASSVVLISMPSASAAVVLSPVYGLWLELLSRDMPPMLFVRGGRHSVMTYSS